MGSIPLRLGWACVCAAVWPVYYVSLFVRWLLNLRFWSPQSFFEEDDRVWEALRNPPFIHRLRSL